MPGDYAILATIHDELNMGSYAQQITPNLINLAQQNGWLGRKVLDIGCGIGENLKWLSSHSYIVTGVDRSAEMLALANTNLSNANTSAELLQQDILSLERVSDADLVLAVDVLHELRNIREIEAAFKQAHRVLKADKWLVFDMYTIEGLVQRNQSGDTLQHDANGLTIFAQNAFDYERQVQQRDYMIFRQNGDSWQRQNASRILRAYPIQALTTLLGRSGFEVLHVFNQQLETYSMGDSATRVIIMAQKR